MRIKLAKHWIDELARLPESGMGFQRVDITLSDGRVLEDLVVLNSEWLEAESSIDPTTITAIRLRESRGRNEL